MYHTGNGKNVDIINGNMENISTNIVGCLYCVSDSSNSSVISVGICFCEYLRAFFLEDTY